MTAVERRLAGANLLVALVALFGGVTTGIFQALEYAGVEIYPSLAPVIRSHYHSLSIHGVLNALVFTTFFICGFLPFIFSRALTAPLACPNRTSIPRGRRQLRLLSKVSLPTES